MFSVSPMLRRSALRRSAAVLAAAGLAFGGVTVLASEASAVRSSCVQGYVSRGSTGPCVRDVQFLLRNVGYGTVVEDGRFGPRTDAAVRAFQRRRGLAVDGIVGPRTYRSLFECYAHNAPGQGCRRRG